MSSRISIITSLLAATTAASSATLTVATVPSTVLEDNLRSAPTDNYARQKQIFELFRRAGCSGANLEERALKRTKFSNIVCTLRGKEGADVVTVGAHFDHVAEGDGIVDNWSGASLLPALYAALCGEPRNRTFVFIAFAREEEGFIGSREFVKNLSKDERAQIRAMINIDSIGLAEPAIWLNHSDRQLALDALAVSRAVGVPLEAVNVDQVGDSDASSFIAAKIPSVDFHSVRRETFAILHSKRDNVGAIDMNAYADTWRFIANYLAYLDGK